MKKDNNNENEEKVEKVEKTEKAEKTEKTEKKEKEFSVDFDKEALKSQTKDTVNQVKETFKNADFKKEADATKGFILELISKPVTTIKNIVEEKENRFPNAVILMICFAATAVIYYILNLFVYPSDYNKFKLNTFVIRVLSTFLFIFAFSASTYLFSGKNKKNITTILSGIMVSFTPYIISNVLDIVELFVDKIVSIGFVFSTINNALNFAAMGLLLYAVKGLISSEGNEDADFRKAVVIVCVAYAAIAILRQLGIYSFV